MIRALLLIFTPSQEWEKLSLSNLHWAKVLFLYFIPLVLVAAGVEGYSLHKFGIKRTEFSGYSAVPLEQVIKYQAVAMGSIFLAALIAAQLVKKTAWSVNVRVTYFMCFATMVYGLGPLILAHLLDAIPQFPTWIAFTIGIALVWSALYHGVALMLKPEQTKGFGLYVFSGILLTLLTGLGHFVALQVLKGKFWPATEAGAVSLLSFIQ